MSDKNGNKDKNQNQSNDSNTNRYNEQYRGRDPRYDDQNISGDRSEYNKRDNDEKSNSNDQDQQKNYGTSGNFGYKADPENDNNRRMDRQSGNRKMRTNYGNNYEGWGGYNEDNRKVSGSSGNTDHYGSYNEGYGSNETRSRSNRNDYGDKDSGNNYQGSNSQQDRDLWDRSRDELSSWFGDKEAERRREMDKITGGHRGKGPRGYQRSEERIREDVCDRLTEDPGVDATDIEVQVQGNEVVLSGNVKSRQEKRRAEDLVDSISGVKNVENRIRVNRPDN